MNVDISSALNGAVKQAVASADVNRFIQKFAAEFQVAIDAEYERIIEDAIQTGSGWLWDYLSHILSEATETAVYGRYFNSRTGEPNVYKRRYKNGGLADPNNIRLELTSDGVIARNITRGKNEDVLLENIILTGIGYKYKEGRDTTGSFRQPRDFYFTAQKRYNPDYVSNRLEKELNARAQTVADEVIKRIS